MYVPYAKSVTVCMKCTEKLIGRKKKIWLKIVWTIYCCWKLILEKKNARNWMKKIRPEIFWTIYCWLKIDWTEKKKKLAKYFFWWYTVGRKLIGQKDVSEKFLDDILLAKNWLEKKINKNGQNIVGPMYSEKNVPHSFHLMKYLYHYTIKHSFTCILMHSMTKKKKKKIVRPTFHCCMENQEFCAMLFHITYWFISGTWAIKTIWCLVVCKETMW